MEVYLDTSALIKLYIEETGREMVIGAVSAADRIVTSTTTYAEARAGLARRFREGDFTRDEHRTGVADLDRDWNTYLRLPVRESIALHAGELAERYALRGYDAIHLASALYLAERFEDLRFLAFDQRLVDSARQARLPVYAS